MKKILYFMMAALLCVAAVSCKKHKTVELNFEKCWLADYEEMTADYDSTFRFYYAQATMNMSIDEVATIDSVKLDMVEVLFQTNDSTVVKYIHNTDGSVKKEVFKGHWAECMNIHPDSVCMTLMAGIDLVSRMDCVKPHSNIVVMRCPLYPPFNEHPYYIFGDQDENLSINSCDDMPEPTPNDSVNDTVEQ